MIYLGVFFRGVRARTAILAQYFRLGREAKMIKFRFNENYNKIFSPMQEKANQVAHLSPNLLSLGAGNK